MQTDMRPYSSLPVLLRLTVITSREIHSPRVSYLEAFVVAFGVANEAIFPHSPREMVIEGVLLPLAVANEFHGKYFHCVSDEICA